MVEHKSLSKSLISKLFMHGVSIYSLMGKKMMLTSLHGLKNWRKFQFFNRYPIRILKVYLFWMPRSQNRPWFYNNLMGTYDLPYNSIMFLRNCVLKKQLELKISYVIMPNDAYFFSIRILIYIVVVLRVHR